MNAEKENTFRALQDDPLLVASWLCRFGWHRWEKWSDPYVPKGGQNNIQTASCGCCNKLRLRTVKDQDGLRK